MRTILFLTLLLLINCKKEQLVYAPEGSKTEKSDMQILRDRAKNINEVERRLIEEWMKHQNEKFYPTSKNFWTNIEGFEERKDQPKDLKISYSYFIYDFEGTKVYSQEKGFRDIPIGKVNDIKAVEDAVNKLKIGEKVRLLVPSALAFGPYGDGKKIGNDIPLIIDLTIIATNEK